MLCELFITIICFIVDSGSELFWLEYAECGTLVECVQCV